MQSYINIKSIHLTLCQLVSKTSPLVGFKSKAYDWLVLNSKQKGVRLWDSNIRRLTNGWIQNFIVRT